MGCFEQNTLSVMQNWGILGASMGRGENFWSKVRKGTPLRESASNEPSCVKIGLPVTEL